MTTSILADCRLKDRWTDQVAHWPTLIGGKLDGRQAIITPPRDNRLALMLPPKLRTDDSVEPEPPVEVEHYTRRVLAHTNERIVVGFVHAEVTTDEARLQIIEAARNSVPWAH